MPKHISPIISFALFTVFVVRISHVNSFRWTCLARNDDWCHIDSYAFCFSSCSSYGVNEVQINLFNFFPTEFDALNRRQMKEQCRLRNQNANWIFFLLRQTTFHFVANSSLTGLSNNFFVHILMNETVTHFYWCRSHNKLCYVDFSE